jgi:hypothetical protein
MKIRINKDIKEVFRNKYFKDMIETIRMFKKTPITWDFRDYGTGLEHLLKLQIQLVKKYIIGATLNETLFDFNNNENKLDSEKYIKGGAKGLAGKLIEKIDELKVTTKDDLNAANEEVKKDALKAKARKKEETAAATAAAKATKKEDAATTKAAKTLAKAEKSVTKKKLSLQTNLKKILQELSVFLEKPGTDKITDKDELILMILIIIYYNNRSKSGKMRVDSTRILEEIQNQSKDNIIEKYNYAMKKLFGEEANLQLIGATNIKNLSEQLKTILQKMK